MRRPELPSPARRALGVRDGAARARRVACAIVIAAGAMVVALAASPDAVASRRDWTGTAACGACHPAQLAAWQATRHALTRDRFTAAARPEGRCLACHGTGEAPAGPAIAVEVGCEACHGAGAAYGEDDVMRNLIVARALGLEDLSTPKARAAVCARCHARGLGHATFDPTAPVHPIRMNVERPESP